MQVAAPTIAARMKEDPGAVWRKLWGANAENNLTEIRMAATLPRPLNRPPQMRGEYRGRNIEVSGSVMRATMLFPTSFAPLPKARTNNTPSPRSAVTDIGGPHLSCSVGTLFTTIGCQKPWDDICRVILLPLERGGGPLHISYDQRSDERERSESNSAKTLRIRLRI